MNLAIAAFGFLLMVAYVPGWSGAATSGRWIVCALACGLLLIAGRIVVTWGHILAAAFLALATASLLWTASPYDAWDALWKLGIVAGLFVLASSDDFEIAPFWSGALFGIAISSALTVGQMVGVFPAPALPRSGLFINGLHMAEAAAVVAAATFVHPLGRNGWTALAWGPALLLPLGRGPLLAICLAWLMGLDRRMGLVVLGIGCVVGSIILVSFSMIIFPAHRPDSVIERITMWRDVLNTATFWGHGLGSYGIPFRSFVSPNDHPHNEFLWALYELGVPGLILFAGLCLMVLFAPAPDGSTERTVIIVLLVEATFGFPFHLPATGCCFALVAGRACNRLGDWRVVSPASRSLA